MTMRFVPIDGGRCWEWASQEWRFRAVALYGSRTVTLYYQPVAEDDAEWTVSHERETAESVKSVAEEMCRDTSGDPGDLMARLRITQTWLVNDGEHVGKIGVGMAPLYVTSAELKTLRAITSKEND